MEPNLPSIDKELLARSQRIIQFKMNILETFQVEDDYLEFLEALALVQVEVTQGLYRALTIQEKEERR